MRNHFKIKKCLVIEIILILLIVSSLFSDSPDDHNNRGFELSNKGLYNEAIEEYKKAVELDPTSSVYHNNLAFAYLIKGDYNSAIEECRKAVEFLQSQKPFAWSFVNGLLAQAYFYSGEFKLASYHYNQAIKYNVRFKKQFKRKIIKYAEMYSLPEENCGWENFLRSKAGRNGLKYQDNTFGNAFNEYSDRGYALFQKGLLDEAILEYKKGVEIEPADIVLHKLLSLVYYFKRDYDSTIEECRKAIELSQNDKSFGWSYINSTLAEAYLNKGEYRMAVYHYNFAIENKVELDEEFVKKISKYTKMYPSRYIIGVPSELHKIEKGKWQSGK